MTKVNISSMKSCQLTWDGRLIYPRCVEGSRQRIRQRQVIYRKYMGSRKHRVLVLSGYPMLLSPHSGLGDKKENQTVTTLSTWLWSIRGGFLVRLVLQVSGWILRSEQWKMSLLNVLLNTFSSLIVSLTVASRVLWNLSCWELRVMEDLKSIKVNLM